MRFAAQLEKRVPIVMQKQQRFIAKQCNLTLFFPLKNDNKDYF